MNQNVLAISSRLVPIPVSRIQVNSKLPPGGCLIPSLQHPALSYASEGVAIHNSLDLSFQRAIAVSDLDRHLIDELTRVKPPLHRAELLAS